MTRSHRRLVLGVLAATAAGSMLVGSQAAVADAPPGSFEVDYDASGTSTIAKTGSTVTLGPTVLRTYVSDSGDGSLTGDLPLPQTSTSFKAVGLLPTTAKVSFIPAGQVTGSLSAEPPLTISATARYYLKLTDVTVAGLPALVGDACQTAVPVAIPVATPAGQTFDLTDGGTLTGSYTITDFANCGLTTPLINLLVPGPGNTVTLQVTNGRFA